MKMVTRGKSASRGNIDVQLRQCPDPDMYVFDLHVFFPQPIVISDNKSPFFLFTSHAYSWQFHMCWVSVFIGAGTFHTKYLHYHLLFLLSPPPPSVLFVTMNLNTLSTWRMASGCWTCGAPHFILIPEDEKKKKYDKCWHLHFKCHPFLKRVWRDGLRRYSNTEITLCPIRMKRLVILLLSNLLSESPGEENKTSHDMWKTPLCLLSYLKVRK